MCVNIDIEKLSPMMQQYWTIKKKFMNHVLFYRVGDFYEMFFDDALRVSKLLELTLTSKECGLDNKAPMCGVPYHACDVYLKKLIGIGERVAICEQLSEATEGKGLVERQVVKVVTPGTLTESSMLNDSTNNYIGAVFVKENDCSICFTDISTGAVFLYKKTGKDMENQLINELSKYNPVEMLYNAEFNKLKLAKDFLDNRIKCTYEQIPDEDFLVEDKKNIILKQFNVKSLFELNLLETSIETQVIAGLFNYIYETQKSLIGRFTEIIFADNGTSLGIDFTARRNLELTETMRNKEKRGTLLWVLDHTQTAMGKRLLKTFVEQPLVNPAMIIGRLEAVEQLCKKSVLHADLTEALNKVYDLERLMTRVMYKTATPRDLKSLSMTALQIPEIKKILSSFTSNQLTKCNNSISTLHEISNLVENSIIDEPPVSVKDGNVIKEGFNAELDNLRSIIANGKGIIDDIEQREKIKTGIKNLKIGYNRVFGYYIEVTKSYYDLIPADYIRKQTLSNCERFITEELKHEENKILGANDKVLVLEAEIYSEVRDFIATKLVDVQKTAAAIALVDVLVSFAYVSLKNLYTRPDISADGVIDIKDGRHPVVELMLKDEIFVPNDTYLDQNLNRMSIITGPNMSGKSTFMRQVALIVIMAQIGCFVPASYAKIPVVDKIFTRIGASDDLTAGQSTFMVEMSEVADILKHATKESLVILDEVGRGTSTFDGISIAQAVAEQIANKRILGCKTLFATHYHELIKLPATVDGIRNFSIAVKKRGDEIIFLRKIVPGGVDESYGIEVAKLAGVPKKVIERARELLNEMEKQASTDFESTKKADQISFLTIDHDRIIDKIRKTNISELTDSDAKFLLEELVKMV